MILDEYVEVKINARNIGWYRSRGYECEKKDIISINPMDLQKGSHCIVTVSCDVCNNISSIAFKDLVKTSHNFTRIHVCPKCNNYSTRQTCLERYGVESTNMLPEVKEKKCSVMMERYGADSPLKIQKFKEKAENTCLERFGVKNANQSPEVRKKTKQTCLKKYGVEYPMQSEAVKDKTKQTNIEKYGTTSLMQNKEIANKCRVSMYENNSTPTSFQQRYLNQLYGGELNYPCDFYSLDVFLPEYKLDIEYDGGGHNLAVKHGEISQEEFNQKEIIRGKYVRSKGYKQMRIISPHDHLPSDKVLKDMLNETTTFLLTTNHTWIEWYVEEGKYKDATGTYDYDYGELITKRQLYSKLNEEIPEQSSDCSF